MLPVSPARLAPVVGGSGLLACLVSVCGGAHTAADFARAASRERRIEGGPLTVRLDAAGGARPLRHRAGLAVGNPGIEADRQTVAR